MKTIYIAGPYNAANAWLVQQNIREAGWIAAYYWCEGYAVICPHMNTAFFGGLISEPIFLKGCIELLSKCDEIALHQNWRESYGSTQEYNYAVANNIPRKYPKMASIRKYLNV